MQALTNKDPLTKKSRREMFRAEKLITNESTLIEQKIISESAVAENSDG